MHNVSDNKPVLVVDIGNTNIVCAIYLAGKAVWTARLFSSHQKTADEYHAILSSMLAEMPVQTTGSEFPVASAIRRENIAYIALGSVVPELTRVWKHLFRKYFPAELIEINALSPLGLKYKVKNPSFIGSDLVANAFGAWHKYSSSAIIIDLGTATTIQVVGKSGSFEGAIIAPGLKTGATNLFSSAAQLYELEIVSPPVLLGSNTSEAVLSGIIHGHAFMLESFIQKLKKQYFDHNPLLTILSGGMADLIKPLVPSADLVDKNLTTDGFYLAMLKVIETRLQGKNN